MVQMRMEGFKKISDDLERVIEKDDSNSSTTTESEDGKQIPLTFREKLCHLLHTNKFQIAVVTLVVIDCILVISELLIDLEILEVDKESSAPEVIHYISIGILSIFMIEIAVKIFAFRLDFFKSKMEVFDAIIVVVLFVLDIVYASAEGVESAVGLIIILRLWRVTRILNGIIMSVKIQAEKRLARERRCREALEQEILKYREYCTAQENEIEALQGLLRKHGIDFDRVERPVVGSTIDVVAEVNEFSEKVKMMDQDDLNPPSA